MNMKKAVIVAFAFVAVLVMAVGVYMIYGNQGDSTVPIDFDDTVEYQGQTFPLLVSNEEEGACLYAPQAAEYGAVLLFDNNSRYFDWLCMSPRLLEPKMKVFDYDGDGGKEVAVVLNNGSGTYVDIDELHIVEAGSLEDYVYSGEELKSDIEAVLSHSFYEREGTVYLDINASGSLATICLSDLYPDETNINAFNFIIYTDYTKYQLQDDGSIQLSMDLCVNTDSVVLPATVAKIKAGVAYAEGKFSLTKPTVKAVAL